MTPAPKANLLVIDDEEQIVRLVRYTLEADGMKVFEASTGTVGLLEAASLQPDAIILDLGLPDLDGIEVLRRLREWTKVPVLVLTVRDSENDTITAFDVGADDYLTKPFRSRELLVRTRAILRRAHVPEGPSVVRFGDVEMDLSARLVRRSGQEVHLTAKEYAMLSLLVRHRGKVITHRQILHDLWGPGAEQKSHYLRTYMIRLRQKLEADPGEPRFLLTESGIGYRLLE